MRIDRISKLKSEGVAEHSIHSLSSVYAPFRHYGIVIDPQELKQGDPQSLANQINDLLLKNTLKILDDTGAGYFPVGVWSLINDVSSDRRIAVSRKNHREPTNGYALGMELLSKLPMSVATEIKPVYVAMIRSNKYNRLDTIENNGIVRLTHHARIYDALMYEGELFPPASLSVQSSFEDAHAQQLAAGKLFPVESDLNELIYKYVCSTEPQLLDSLNTLPGDWKNDTYRHWGVLRGTAYDRFNDKIGALQRIHQDIIASQSTYQLMWYDQALACSPTLLSRNFIVAKHAQKFLAKIIEQANGMGVIHPFIDGFISERVQFRQLYESLRQEATAPYHRGRLMRKNLGHIQLVQTSEMDEFRRRFKPTILRNKLADHVNKMGMIEDVILCQFEQIDQILSERTNKKVDDKGNTRTELAILAPNLSGFQPKFGANIVFVDGHLQLHPAANDVAFTHIAKPSSSGGDAPLMPIAEWVSLSAAKAAGLKTAQFALLNYSRICDTLPEMESAETEASKALHVSTEKTFYNMKKNAWASAVTSIFVSERFDISTQNKPNQRRIGIDIAQMMGVNVLENSKVKYNVPYEVVAEKLKIVFAEFGSWDAEKYEFLKQGIFSWLIADSDLHIKNMSVLLIQELDEQGKCYQEHLTMAPVYDRVSVLGLAGRWSYGFSLAVEGKRKLTSEDWCNFAEKYLNIPDKEVVEITIEMAKKILQNAWETTSYLIKESDALAHSSGHVLQEFAESFRGQLYLHMTEFCGLQVSLPNVGYLKNFEMYKEWSSCGDKDISDCDMHAFGSYSSTQAKEDIEYPAVNGNTGQPVSNFMDKFEASFEKKSLSIQKKIDPFKLF